MVLLGTASWHLAMPEEIASMLPLELQNYLDICTFPHHATPARGHLGKIGVHLVRHAAVLMYVGSSLMWWKRCVDI